MDKTIAFPSTFIQSWFSFALLLFALFLSGTAWAGKCNTSQPSSNGCNCQDINLACPVSPAQEGATYGTAGATLTGTDAQIKVCNAGTTSNVTWQVVPQAGCATTSDPAEIACGGMKIKAPAAPGLSAPVGSPVVISGTTPSSAKFRVTVTDANDESKTCGPLPYTFQSTGGGWGDPHITTVDGVHYDFQSAGEFTALRGDDLEIQTRQTRVATRFVGLNPDIGLPTCVAVYSAVAARVCDHRVSLQPNISGNPDPSGLQLYVDGVLTTLGPEGIDLTCGPIINSPTRRASATPLTGARIVKSAVGGGIEIHYSDGTHLVVTPDWWPDQQKWYLNVNVYGTTATEGIWGKLAKGSWLPALSDGTSLGPKPDTPHQRYVDLYEKFADAWRVTDATSLFTYKSGPRTATFTDRSWPRENPKSCAIEGEPSAEPVDVGVAEKACSAIVDPNMKADCVFDVRVTGHTGFAQTYQLTQQLQPGLTVTTVKDDKDPTQPGESVTFTATVAQKLPRGGGAPTGAVQFIVDGSQVGNPVLLDSNGQASWSTASLLGGKHQIEGKYIPTGWGGLFMASSSPKESHAVSGKKDAWAFGLHGGFTVPHGSLSNGQSESASFGADLEYKLSQLFSFGGYVGHDRFSGKGNQSDFYLTHASGFGKLTFGTGPWRPSVHTGLGAYFAKGGDVHVGWNVGTSLEYWFTNRIAIEGSYDYRHVFASSPDLRYSTFQLGLRFSF